MGRYRAPIQKAKMGMPRNVPKLLAPSVLHSDDEGYFTRRSGAILEPLAPMVFILVFKAEKCIP